MIHARLNLLLTVVAASSIGASSTLAQQSMTHQFRAHNSRMAELQPSLITPLVAPDPRLVQYVKFAFANQYTSMSTQTVSFGNGRGGGVIAGNRFEFDVIPPSYIEHNSKAMDGFGDSSTLAKYRIASGNAAHGNFEVTALLARCFATGSYKNGALTDSFSPGVVFGKTVRRFDGISSLGATLPTGKISQLGRTITWNEVIQVHATRAVWFELENNAAFYFAGSRDGKTQNFVTPAAFYVIRRREWKPTHPFFILDGGMQIATSGFHTYNHNTISELRVLF